MKKLFDGVTKFYEEDYNNNKSFYESLKKNKPHTLFVTCVDSRIDPNRLTNSSPGNLLVVRNLGNIIPPYKENNQLKHGYLATTSSIEYAICKLEVRNIIVCGHSNCGACNAIYDKETTENMPYVSKWLELLNPIKDQVLALNPDTRAKRTWLTELLNIREQLSNLITYPFVEERYSRGVLNIFGWYYIIDSGEILNYDLIKREFKSIIKKA